MHAANRYSNQTIPKRMTKQAFLLITNKKSIWVSVRLMIIMIFCCFMEMSFGFRKINLKSFSSKSDMFHYFTYLACATKKKQNFMFWIIRFKSFFFFLLCVSNYWNTKWTEEFVYQSPCYLSFTLLYLCTS